MRLVRSGLLGGVEPQTADNAIPGWFGTAQDRGHGASSGMVCRRYREPLVAIRP